MQCDELVYNTLMDGCVKANDLSAGVGLFAEMASAGMRPSSITHSAPFFLEKKVVDAKLGMRRNGGFRAFPGRTWMGNE